MIRLARVLPLVLSAVAPLVLAGCGSEKSGGTEAEAGAQAGVSRELGARARALGVAPELVYVTEAPGFRLAQQSVGVFGGDGFSATYVSRQDGRQIRLTVDRGSVSDAGCGTKQAACERDGEGIWYRGGGGQQEYLVAGAGHVVRVQGDAGVSREVLREAARDVHRPAGDEVAEVLPPTGPGDAPAPAAPAEPAVPTAPVDRSDLPPDGDGAPRNDVDAGG
ncbi:hypothetical protein ACIHFC_02970 [Streptomyces sp. NPDC052013]|uniref:hypothetical protein n=1 Tax=Streptomyces sp. NPDC052013 TaxID=3365679 RepID=UPI0037D97564